MALQKQVVRMSVDGGLDTKTDDKNVLPTDFLELENIRFSKTKAFIKRNGYDAYTNNVLGSTPITDGKALATFNNELLRYNANNIFSYSESENQWVDKGITKYALSTEYSVASNGYKLLNPCHYTLSNLTVYAYEKNGVSSTDIEYRVIDNPTGSVLFTGDIASATLPMVCGIYGTFFIFYFAAGVIYFRTINFGDPSTLSAATAVTTAASAAYDVQQIGDKAYFVAPGATGLNVGYVASDSSIAGPIAIPDASAFNRVAVSSEGANIRYVYGGLTGTVLKTILYSPTLTAPIHSAVTLEASTDVSSVACIQSPSSSSASQIYASIAVDPYILKKYKVSSAGAIASSGTVINQVSLQSKLINVDNKIYFACSKSASYLTASPFRTYFIGSEDGNLLTKFTIDAGVFRAGATLPNMNSEDDDTIAFTGGEAAQLQANLATSAVTVPTTIKKFLANFSQLNNYFDAQLGNNLHIAGGILKMYDGDAVVEHNFLETPPTPVFVSETATGAVLTDGTYQYIAVYKWTDKWGQVHRSTTSLPLSYTVTGGPKKPTIRVFTLTLTQKDDVIIEIYRTEVNGTTFYLRSYNYADVILNDPSVESITFTDTMSDAELINNEILYTTGGVLDNVAANSSKQITSYKARLFVLGSDGYTLQYTKVRQQNEPANFAAEFQINLDAKGGVGTTLAVMDDNLIIFKEQALFALNGQGPNPTGQDDDYRTPVLITSDAGCVDANSIVVSPIGLMFKSSKGIYLLDRQLGVSYIGDSVAGYNDLTITSATLLQENNEIRFTTDSDLQLVYDYYVKKWATDTNIDAVDSVLYNGAYTYIRENGEVMLETPGLYSDNGSYISIKITTSWMSLAGIQGFERFYQMMLLGTYITPHTLKVRFAYDYDPSWGTEATIDAGVLATPTYGDGFYGTDTYGSSFPLYQFRIFPERQKCQAFKFSISDYGQGENGAGFQLSNFSAELGLKTGSWKKAAARSYGAS